MSLWQIMKYRSGWTAANTARTEEEAGADEMRSMSDDDFFAAMNTEIIEGDVISENAFMVAIKKGG